MMTLPRSFFPCRHLRFPLQPDNLPSLNYCCKRVNGSWNSLILNIQRLTFGLTSNSSIRSPIISFKMPPRIQSRTVSNTLLPYLTATSSSSSSLSSLPSLSSTSSQCISRQFSATAAPRGQTKLRRQMFEWLDGEGAVFKHHLPGQTNYVTSLKQRDSEGPESARPFPNNQSFFSEPILSEELRNEVYNRIIEQKKSARVVSTELGIDMKRIAAVVRLVELEKRQRAQVRSPFCPFRLLSFWTLLQPSTHMMSHKKSISLEDTHMVKPYFLN